jgi:hypothetical protein
MDISYKRKVISIVVELTMDEAEDVAFWFANRNTDPASPAIGANGLRHRNGFTLMQNLTKAWREVEKEKE